MGLKGSFAGELILITGRKTTEKTLGICLYFSATPGLLPSSQPPISCLEEGAGNAILNPRNAEDCQGLEPKRLWAHLWGAGSV